MPLSPPVEDTVKAIYQLQQDSKPPVATSDIAAHLDKTQATVTNALDRLEDEGYVTREPYRGSELTDAGETIAVETIRRHRLIETFLVECLDYSWDEIHEEADTLEHHVSERFETRLVELLNDPQRDPHGEPIPNESLEGPGREATSPLTTCGVGEQVVIARIDNSNKEDLEYLADIGVAPGSTVQVIDTAPFGMVKFKIDNEKRALPERVASSVYVTNRSDATDPVNLKRQGDA